MNHRRLLTLVAAVALVAAACGGDNDDSASPDDEDELRGGEMTWGQLVEITTLSPYPGTAGTFALRSVLYEPLVKLDVNREPVGVLAEEFEISPDSTGLTLTLRDGVMFHDGTPLDADAVLWNFDRLLEDDVTTQGKEIFVDADISAPDPSTVTITFPAPTPQAMDLLEGIVMVSPEAGLDGGIGTGPFRVDDFAAGDSLRAVANDDYWLDGSPLLDSVTLQTFPDLAALVAAVEAGSVQYLTTDPPRTDAVRLQSNDDVRVETTTSIGQWHLLVNPTKGCLTDPRVRQALSLAFDRERFVETSMQGFAAVQTQMFTPKSPAYSDALNSEWTFDLDAARSLIEEADCDVQVEVQSGPHLPELDSFLPVYAEDLASIGVEATIREQDVDTWLDNFQKGNFELTIHNYGPADRDPAAVFATAPFRLNNPVGQWTEDPAFTDYAAMAAAAQAETDPDTRTGMYVDIAQLVQQEALSITVANPQDITISSTSLKEITFISPLVDLTRAYIDE